MRRKIYDSLLNWKQNNIKLPYMLIGARQTGKTYILKEFCKNEFENNIYINLENMEDIRKIFEETIIPKEIIKNLEALLVKKINIDSTIIFIDEIQVSERAVNSLKYFAEDELNYKIVCAGSLLGVKVNRFKSSFPVGKVWIEYMYPMDFEEFLWATKEEESISLIKENYERMTPILAPIHNKLMKLYKEYLCIGGMPTLVNEYLLKDKNIYDVEDDKLEQIIVAYIADMSKYTENTETIKNNKIYNSMPEQLAKPNKKFKYSLVDKSARKREYETSLEWLLSSNMIIKSSDVKLPQSPLKAYVSGDFKIYLSDVGLLRKLSEITINEIMLEKNAIYKGVLAENYVAQELNSKYKYLYYWSVSNNYEIDFLINIEGDIIPIEVKASDNTRSTSLNYYIQKYSPKYSIRISSKNFGFENNIKSIPLYATFLI